MAVVVLHVFDLDATSYLARELLGSLHAPGFAVIAAMLALAAGRRFRPRVALVIAATVSLALGLVSEFLQVFTSRDADLADVAFDILGILTGIAVVAAIKRNELTELSRGMRKIMPLVAFAGVICTCYLTVFFSTMIASRWIAVPDLLSFDSAWEGSIHLKTPDNALEIIPAPAGWPANGEYVGLLRLDGVKYPGLIFDPYPNWQGYAGLSFLVASASGNDEPFQIRIHDNSYRPGHYSRYDRLFLANPEPRRVRIEFTDLVSDPDGGMLDIEKILEIRIRSLRPASGSWLIVDDFRLENE